MFKSIFADNHFFSFLACLLLDSHLFYVAPRLYFAQPFLDMGYELNGHNVVLLIKVVSSTLCRSHNIIYFSRRFNIINT